MLCLRSLNDECLHFVVQPHCDQQPFQFSTCKTNSAEATAAAETETPCFLRLVQSVRVWLQQGIVTNSDCRPKLDVSNTGCTASRNTTAESCIQDGGQLAYTWRQTALRKSGRYVSARWNFSLFIVNFLVSLAKRKKRKMPEGISIFFVSTLWQDDGQIAGRRME